MTPRKPRASAAERLRAITGEQNIVSQEPTNSASEAPAAMNNQDDTPSASQENWSGFRASNVYEGTDSEDEEMIVSTKKLVKSKPVAIPGNVYSDTGSSSVAATTRTLASAGLQSSLRLGELSAPGISLCPFDNIKKYPFKYIGHGNRQRVVESYFDGGLLFFQPWDFYYIYKGDSPQGQAPVLLVPTRQVEDFLVKINQDLGTKLTIPFGSRGLFEIRFLDDGTPRPRWLGESHNKITFEKLKGLTPPKYYKFDNEGPAKVPDQHALNRFQQKMDLIAQAGKGGGKNKAAQKENKFKQRHEKQKEAGNSIKRVQRYLGLRQLISRSREEYRKHYLNMGLERTELEEAVAEAMDQVQATFYDPHEVVAFENEDSVVFVSVDVEAYEKAPHLITEIGVATLDTNDLKGIAPGDLGKEWFLKIRARHFRIDEHKHLNNTEFVNGCADNFEFGTSEFIRLRDAPQWVASCFKHPFSEPNVEPVLQNPKRKVVLVGHDIDADIAFLQKIGYDVFNLSNLHEVVDTATMWKFHKKETNPRNLGAVLCEMGIEAWHLHNAGNDAAYTLQAMVCTAVKQILRREEEKGKETSKEDRDGGWASEGSDGGVAVAAIPKQHQQQKIPLREKENLYRENPWKNQPQDPWANQPTQPDTPTTESVTKPTYPARTPQELLGLMNGPEASGNAETQNNAASTFPEPDVPASMSTATPTADDILNAPWPSYIAASPRVRAAENVATSPATTSGIGPKVVTGKNDEEVIAMVDAAGQEVRIPMW